MSVLDNILDLAVKYGPEVSQYFSGQKRIRQAIEDQRREQLPDFGRRSATGSEQMLSNLANRDLFAGQKDEARRQFQGALTTAGKTKGGMRNLASLLGASGRVQQQLGDAEVTQRRASAQAAAPFERAIQDYNMQVDDQEKMYDLMKERQINSLEDQAQRMRGRGARTLFDILGDSRGLLAGLGKKQDTFSGGTLPEVTITPDSLDDKKTLRTGYLVPKAKGVSPSSLEGILTNSKYVSDMAEVDAMSGFTPTTPNNVPRVSPGTIQDLLKFLTNR